MDRRQDSTAGSAREGTRGCPACSRRRVLGGVGAAALASLAGCRGVVGDRSSPTDGPGDEEPPTSTPDPTSTATDVPYESYREVSLPVPEEELARGASKDTIAAITEPAFGSDWSRAEIDLVDEDRVIGVLEPRTGEGGTAAGGGERRARAYPLPILNWHEVVNDEFGVPLLVSFCPLCGSGVVADRTVEGRALTFGVSGLLWESDLVMYDEETGSLWSQLLAKAIQGELTGTQLRLRPSTLTTWGQWRASYPDSEILLPSPISKTVRGEIYPSYERDPYLSYARGERIGIGGNEDVDDRLHPKTLVIGIAHGGVARAYPLSEVVEAGRVVNDTVGGLPVVVAAAGTTLVAYARRVDGEVLAFERDGEALVAGGSRWDPLAGRALDGPFEGRELDPANDRSPLFWFAWADFFPETEIYEAGGE